MADQDALLSRIADLPPERQAYLARLVEKRVRNAPVWPILPRPVGLSMVPCSFSQERLWFLEQLAPESAAYNIGITIQVTGALDLHVLERSLNEVIRRHETLRTVFEFVNGQVMQVIAPSLHVPWAVVDLRHVPEAERVAAVLASARTEELRPFDLQRGPLIRAMNWRVADDVFVLNLTMHHIVTDGWSMGVLYSELGALYAAFAGDASSPLRELRVQYADFAIAQRTWLQGNVLEQHLAYWRRQLADLPTLQLPTDHPRPATPTFRGASHTFTLDSGLTNALRALSQSEGVTLFMTLLAAFQTLLALYSGQDEVVVGIPSANRNRVEIEGLIGFFVNTLVSRIDLSGDPTVRTLLRLVREVMLGAYAHQDLPFEKLVEEVQPERVIGRNPLFQVMFTLQTAQRGGSKPAGLSMQTIETGRQTSMVDVTMYLFESEHGLIGMIEYSTDLFDSETMRRLAGHFRTVLEGMVADPEQRLWDLRLLGEVERLELASWNATERSYDLSPPVHRRVEWQVAGRPEAVALVAEGETLRYGEMDQRANQLAHALCRLGVGPEVLVGVCLERSLDLVVTLLAVLKAGGAYVPLDPGYPVERLAFMLADAACPVVVCHEATRDRLPPSAAVVVDLTSEAAALASEPGTAPEVTVCPDHLAYGIYTSGSTGRPKGALNTHRGIVNRLLWMQETFQLGAEDVVLQKTPASFDVSVWEFFWPLLAGARLVLARPEGQKDPAYLGDLIAEHHVTTLHFVPSMLAAFLDAAEPATCRSLRRIVCSGEALAPDLAARCRRVLPWVALWNLYGPTEAAVDVTVWRVPGEGPLDRVPIGCPVANTRCYVLNADLRPVPVNIPGELYLGGVQVGRGYLARPELTAERFVPDPFGSEAGARLYRTGDRARWRGDGAIEYLGRLDGQVKLRGQRIELGEIEMALRALSGVREAAALLREDRPGDARLVGYVVPRDGVTLASGDIRRALGRVLPEAMIPSAFLSLASLPLLPNGKLDRKALPAPGPAPDDASVYVAPRTPTEEIVAGIWVEVLGAARVGMQDNFFELGGHSLLATQVVARVRQILGVVVALRTLFAAPMLADFAREVEATVRSGAEDDALPLSPMPRDKPLPLSFPQQRLWVFEQLQPHRSPYSVPAALRLEGRLDSAALRQAFTELIDRHEVLRTILPSVGGQPVQLIRSSVTIPITEVDLSDLLPEAQDGEVQRRVREEVQRPFDLARGPLVRIHLLRLGPEMHVLLLNLHHIVCDAWSLSILVRELSELYRAGVLRETADLAPLTVQYADFALWQRSTLAGDRLAGPLAYWKRQLAGLPPMLLPTDRPRNIVQRFVGAVCPLQLPAALLEDLRSLARREGVTLYMTLLAGFQALLSRYTGQEDIAVGTPIAGRSRVELEPLIGFFVNTLVLRTDLSGDPTVGELLARVRRVALDAYAHQEVPFEKLVEALQPDRSSGGRPLVQVVLALQNVPTADLALPGLRLHPVPLETDTAKFDLSIWFTEGAEGLVGAIEYDSDLFDAETIYRLASRYATLLGSIAGDPSQRLSALPLVTAEERRHLLAASNATTTGYPRHATIHELFTAQAARSPEAVALQFGKTTLTYSELDHRTNQLARYLRRLGVGPDVLVGIYAERSADLVVGLLGVLKAGGAYLPLDYSYPKERLAFMLEDVRAPVLLTQASLIDQLPAHHATAVCLDADWPTIAREAEDDVPASATAAHLAYVIFTSGSTGRPKGVAVTHRAVVRLVCDTDYVQLQADDRVAQASNTSFDAATFEIWGALLHGASLIFISKDVALVPAELAAQLRDNRITVMFVTTALFNQVAALSPGAFQGLRYLLFGGEAVDPHAVRRVLEGAPPQRLLHVYGPTETTTFATWHAVCEVRSQATTVPIGGPLANSEAYVLDRYAQLLPLGLPGELFLGGDGLARGYLGRPDLTAERFVPHPFSAEPGARLYRTGDLVRRQADGQIEFLGRLDDQVKLRGFRVELGEIEVALRAHAAVLDAAVTVREDRPGDRRLVAYVVPRDTPATDGGEWRRYLHERLPDYMVPGSFIVLDALPLTSNGKLDRKALPAPDTAPKDDRYVAPRTPSEEVLAGIWATVLRLERVSVEDNFFALGGDSILGIQIVARAGQAGLRLSPQQLFQHQTVTELAAVATPAVATVKDVAPPENIPLTPVQQWLLDQDQPDPQHFNQALLLEARRPLSSEHLAAAAAAVEACHPALRLRFTREADGAWRQSLAEADVARAVRTVTLDNVSESEQGATLALLAAEQQASLDLVAGPIWRLLHVRRGSERPDLLLWVVHHLAVDGVSWRILVTDLQTAYERLERGDPAGLPDEGTSWAVWSRDLPAHAEAAVPEKAYWLAQDAGATGAVPVDGPGGTGKFADVRTVTTPLSPEETHELLQEVPGAYHSQINDILLTALAQTLLPWSGTAALLIDLEGHGREDVLKGADLSHTVGWFTTIFPVRLELLSGAQPGEAVRSMKEQLRAIPAHGIGFGVLRYLCSDLATRASLATLPTRHVCFNYLGQFDQLGGANGLLSLAMGSVGPVQSPRNRRAHLLDCSAYILGGRLEIVWTYNPAAHRPETVERLSSVYVAALRALVAQAKALTTSVYAPSDFPLAGVNQQQLDKFFSKITKKKG